MKPPVKKIDVLPVAPLLGEAIFRLHHGRATDRSAGFLSQRASLRRISLRRFRDNCARVAAISRECADLFRTNGRSPGALAGSRDGSGRTGIGRRGASSCRPRIDAAARCIRRPKRYAQPFAFEAQERDFVQRVDRAQPIVEFEAVDDPDRIAEPNVFRTQITMSVHECAGPARAWPADPDVATRNRR